MKQLCVVSWIGSLWTYQKKKTHSKKWLSISFRWRVNLKYIILEYLLVTDMSTVGLDRLHLANIGRISSVISVLSSFSWIFSMQRMAFSCTCVNKKGKKEIPHWN